MRFPKKFVTSGALAEMRDLTGGDLRVLLELICGADDDGVIAISQRELVEKVGMPRSTVQDCLSRMARMGVIESVSEPRKKATYKVLIAEPNWTGVPVQNWTVSPGQMKSAAEPNWTGTAVQIRQNWTGTAVQIVERPPRVPKTTTGNAHSNESFARAALTTIRKDRHLPLSIEELLQHAYRLGDGDPWAGYLDIKQRTEANLTGAKNLAAVTRARLEAK